MITIQMFLLILGCMVVTWLPRILPFLFARVVTLPAIVTRWLHYVPVCILSALVFDAIFYEHAGTVAVDWLQLMVLAPTLVVAMWTKSLSLTVVVGVMLMALSRLFFT